MGGQGLGVHNVPPSVLVGGFLVSRIIITSEYMKDHT